MKYFFPALMILLLMTGRSSARIARGNLYDPVAPAPEEFVEVLAAGESDTFRIERIVSHGQVSSDDFWYDQDEWEFVAVLQGDAELETESEKFKMNPGDWAIIPEHEKHRVTYTSTEPPCVWLAIFGR